MEEKLLNDRQFLKIQELNSPDADRRSITEPKKVPEQEEKILVEPSEIKINDENVQISPITSEKDDSVFLSHVGVLHDKEKTRYRRGSESFISYFDDVAFEPRPSILDGSIDEPFRRNFQGTILEKEMKKLEKEQRKLNRKGVHVEFKPLETSQSIGNFSGFYVVTWMTIALTFLRVVVDYYLEHGTFTDSKILQFMTTDLFTTATVDLSMYLDTYIIFLIQYCCKKRWIKWHGLGWYLNAIFEFTFVMVYMFLREHVWKLHWVGKIFLFLHSLVVLMKMHSFAFYNGYLWSIWEELQYSKKALSQFKDEEEKTQNVTMIKTLERSSTFCQHELNVQSEKEKFPTNINLKNFFMYSMFPVLVYQIEYPRTKKIRWNYVFQKVCAIFGTIILMMVDADVFMYPVAIEGLALRDAPWISLTHRFGQLVRLLIDMIPGFIVMYLLTFYLIWEAILNCIAELTCFGDRYFYGDWWNCVSWGDFSRIWNVPVHNFLVRHVYHSSMSALKLNKMQASVMTFLISSVIHELSMYVIFKRFRLYIFMMQMSQIPLMALSETKYLKDRTILGNLIFWFGICVGPSLMCTLYLTF
uniref:O-acyltransferase n=1 Tax=Naumovozyma castellii TaxID=27288 RepID=Q876A5_NAUCA|nr:ARE2 [Naumovozyma castellii]